MLYNLRYATGSLLLIVGNDKTPQVKIYEISDGMKL